MLITVAICTLNRAESLRRTLDSLAAMRLPDHLDWEVLVVDNGCADHTDAVIEAFAGRLPIRREFEPRRGHTPARNHAVDAAKGEYIVWTDEMWLSIPAGSPLMLRRSVTGPRRLSSAARLFRDTRRRHRHG